MGNRVKRYSRSAAEKAWNAFLARVEEVNKNPYFLYSIDLVMLFGSYLHGNGPTVGDVDVQIRITPRYPSPEQHDREFARENEALKGGQYFRNYVEQVCWPQIEVIRYLKARSPIIQIQWEQGDMAMRKKWFHEEGQHRPYKVILGEF